MLFSSLFDDENGLRDLIAEGKQKEALQWIQEDKVIDTYSFWDDYKTPLHYAVLAKQPKVVKALVEAGADLNPRTYYDRLTPLHCAIKNGDEESAAILIEAGASLDARTYSDASTPLHLAATYEMPTIAEKLLKKGAKVDSINKNYFTPMLISVMGGDKKTQKVLQAYGADKEKDLYRMIGLAFTNLREKNERLQRNLNNVEMGQIIDRFDRRRNRISYRP